MEERLDRIRAAVRGARLMFGTEAELQEGLARVLAAAGVDHRREVPLSKRDRIDFLLPEGIGIEVKIEGALSALTRQLWRYAEHEEVVALVLVTSQLRLTALPKVLNGKAIICLPVSRAFA